MTERKDRAPKLVGFWVLAYILSVNVLVLVNPKRIEFLSTS